MTSTASDRRQRAGEGDVTDVGEEKDGTAEEDDKEEGGEEEEGDGAAAGGGEEVRGSVSRFVVRAETESGRGGGGEEGREAGREGRNRKGRGKKQKERRTCSNPPSRTPHPPTY